MDVEIWTNLPAVPPSAIRRLTRAEYDRLVDLGVFDRERLELIRGVIVRMSPQGVEHSDPIERLNELLLPRLLGRARVRVQMPLIAPDESEPEPDFAVVPLTADRKTHPAEALLVIEVARSSAAYDRETKGPLYAQMGAREYWIVDVGARVIEVRREPRGESWTSLERFAPGQSITLMAFPDVTVEVSAILG